MIDLLQDLVRHKGYANAALLRAICQHEPAAQDPELRELLHHIVGCRSPLGIWACDLFTGSILERNKKVGRRQIAFQGEESVEVLKPEILT